MVVLISLELKNYLGRKIWKSKLSTIANNPENWNVFIKPVEDKKFTGIVVRSTKDLIGCGTYDQDTDILCSEVVNFVAEWRCLESRQRLINLLADNIEEFFLKVSNRPSIA